MSVSLKDRILAEIDQLTIDQQQQVLALAQRLSGTQEIIGTPGDELLEYLDRFSFEAADIKAMLKAIEEDTERVDWDGWQ